MFSKDSVRGLVLVSVPVFEVMSVVKRAREQGKCSEVLMALAIKLLLVPPHSFLEAVWEGKL